MDGAASLLLLLTVAALGSRVDGTPTVWAGNSERHGARHRRGLLDGLAKAIVNPLNVFGRHRGPGSSAHSDSINVGASLPFGISAGISGSSSDAHSSSGDVASASSGGYPQGYGGSGSSASVGPSPSNHGTPGGYAAPASHPQLAPAFYGHELPIKPNSGYLSTLGGDTYDSRERHSAPPRIIAPGTGSTALTYSDVPKSWPVQTGNNKPLLISPEYGTVLGHPSGKESDRKAGAGLLVAQNCGSDANRCATSKEILDRIYVQGVREEDFIQRPLENWKTYYGEGENLKHAVATVAHLNERGVSAPTIAGTDRLLEDRYNPKLTPSSRSAEDVRNSVDQAIHEVFGRSGISGNPAPSTYL